MEYKVVSLLSNVVEQELNKLTKEGWLVVSSSTQWKNEYPDAMTSSPKVICYYIILARQDHYQSF